MDGYVVIGTELDLSGIEKNLDRMVELMERKGEQGAKNASKKMSAAFAIGVSALSTIMMKIMNAIGSSISGAISRVDILNNFPRVMSTLGVNAKDAAESVDYLANKLIGIPTTLDEGVKAVQRFTSANMNVKASTEMYLALNNALLAGGTSMQEQANAMEQVSQAYARNKMEYKEWLALIQTAPAQMRQVAEVMGYSNVEALGKDLREGKIALNDFMATLVRMNKESVNGFATLEEQAREGTKGIGTTLKNLKTTIVRAVGEVMQAIGQANIAAFFQAITDTIKRLIPYIAAFVKSFMIAFTVISSIIGKIGKFFGTLFGKKTQKETQTTSLDYGKLSNAIGGIGDSAKDAAGSAKKLKKELANLQGFDEMNVLQEPSSSGGSGGGTDLDVGGVGDLGALGDIDFGEIGEEVSALGLDVDMVTDALWGLLAAIMTFKTLKLLDKLKLISMSLKDMARISIGVGLAVAGFILIVQGVLSYLEDPTWENFGKVIVGIGLFIAGVAIAFGAWPIAIAGAVVAVIGIVIAFWDKLKGLFQSGIDWLTGKSDWVHEHFGGVIGTAYDLFTSFLQNLLDGFDHIFNGAKKFLDGIIDFVTGIFTLDWNKAWEGIKKMFDGALRAMWGTLQTTFAGFIPIVQGVWNSIVSKIKGIWNGLISFVKGSIKTISGFFTDLGKNGADAIGNAFKGVINFVIGKIENILNKPIKAINGMIDVINTLPGVKVSKFQTFNLPRLARGGIVNNPGPGVMMGNYIAGESGPEAVLPLDDTTMNRLGEAIARHMIINNDNKIYLNTRQVAREISRTKNESDFAFNE